MSGVVGVDDGAPGDSDIGLDVAAWTAQRRILPAHAMGMYGQVMITETSGELRTRQRAPYPGHDRRRGVSGEVENTFGGALNL